MAQLGPLVGGQAGRGATVDVGLLDPAPERLDGDSEIVRDLTDGMAWLACKRGRLQPGTRADRAAWDSASGLPVRGRCRPNCWVSTKPGQLQPIADRGMVNVASDAVSLLPLSSLSRPGDPVGNAGQDATGGVVGPDNPCNFRGSAACGRRVQGGSCKWASDLQRSRSTVLSPAWIDDHVPVVINGRVGRSAFL